MATEATTVYKKRANFSRASLPYLYLAPAFIVMGVITFYPLIYQMIISFSDFALKDLLHGLSSTNLHWIGFKNYVDILTGGLPVQDFAFFRVLTYNFWWAITNVMVHVPAGILIAVLLNINGLWFKKIYRAMYVLPVMIPTIVVATVWRNIFDEQYGAMNQGLTAHCTFIRFRTDCSDPLVVRIQTTHPVASPQCPASTGLLRHDDRQFLAGMAVHVSGCNRRSPKHLQGII